MSIDGESEDLSTCGICYETYNNGKHKPKFLPCSHTFCLTCLQSLIRDAQHFDCPVCKAKISSQDGRIDAFPNNSFALEIIKLNTRLQRNSSEITSGKWCLTCDSRLEKDCVICNHAIISISEEAEELKKQFLVIGLKMRTAMIDCWQTRLQYETLSKSKEQEARDQLAENDQQIALLTSIQEEDENNSHQYEIIKESSKYLQDTLKLLNDLETLTDKKSSVANISSTKLKKISSAGEKVVATSFAFVVLSMLLLIYILFCKPILDWF